MTSPSFSIVVPTYQRRDVVSDAVRAISRIAYSGPVELIVVVDGSSDGTLDALQSIPCPFPAKFIFQENSGPAAARNRGAAEATGEILLFLDDDMMCRPDILDQHALSYGEGAGCVLGHVPLDRESPSNFLSSAAARWADDRARKLADGAPLTLYDLIGGHMSVRRSVFEAAGGFDSQFTSDGSYGDEDLDLGVRLIERFKVVFNSEAIASQRYVVTPREYLLQWSKAGRADVRFARKHPRHAQALFKAHGSRRWLSRLALRPLAWTEVSSRLTCAIALRLAERESNVPASVRPFIRYFFRCARDIAYWTGVRRAGGIPRSGDVLVLCYHAIADLSGDTVMGEYGIRREVFADQLDELIERGFVFIAPDELVALLERAGRVPRKSVLLTFDDCYEDLLEVARTILEPRGVPAIAFAVTGMPSGTNEWDQAVGARKLRLLDSAGLIELSRHGVEIGCHSRSHRPLESLDDEVLCAETDGARKDLEALGLRTPRFFAYPHGVHDPGACAAVGAAGFTAAFGLLSRRADHVSDRFALPRVEVLARDSGWRFTLKTTYPALAPLTRMRSVIGRRAHGIARALGLLRGMRALRPSQAILRNRRTNRPTAG